MPIEGPVPGWVLSIVAGATLFAVMFDLGLAIVPGEFRWVVKRPALLLKGVFSVLIAVPMIALAVTRAIELPRLVEIGIVLMAISPGAPVALRRSMGAGGHRTFAPALQIAVALLAVVSMPLSIAVLNHYYRGNADIDPQHLARQVFFAQLLPLALGMAANRLANRAAAWLEPRLRRLGGLLLILLLVLVLIDIWHVVIDAGWRAALAIALVTTLALAVGHLLGGPRTGDANGDGDLQRGAQSRARPAGGDAQPRPTGDHRHGARLPADRRGDDHPLRGVAAPRDPCTAADVNSTRTYFAGGASRSAAIRSDCTTASRNSPNSS